MNFLKTDLKSIDINKLHNTYISNNPFPHIVLKDIFLDDVLEAVVDGIKKFNNVKDPIWYRLCTKTTDFTSFGKKSDALMKFLISDEWTNFIGKLTGIDGLVSDPSWLGAGINFEPRGSHLELHTDFNIGGPGWRRVNILLFLSKDWNPEWGGQNELWNKDLSKCEVSTDPEFNTLMVFSTSPYSWHGFNPVVCPADRSRKVISCYYYHPSDPGPHTSKQPGTNYKGWGQGRNFEGRSGTGFKEI